MPSTIHVIPPGDDVAPTPPSSANVQRPDDFDEFWSQTLRNLADVPLNLECTRSELRSDESIDTYEVRYDSLGGLRVFAWLCIPKNHTAPLPALITPPGYISDPPIPKDWARQGYAAITPAPRGKVRSRAHFDPGYPGLLTHNITDRRTYAYRGFYCDVVRAIDVLQSRREVDATRIGIYGGSQGGALAIVTAALRADVIEAAASSVPYLSDFLAAIELTRTYPFHEITDYLRTYPERRGQVTSTLAYFDCLNFAPLVRCPTIVNLGMQDNIVPPETCRAVYEAIAAEDKQLYCYRDCGHDGGLVLGHQRIVESFLAEHL